MIVPRSHTQKDRRVVHEDVMRAVGKRLEDCRYGFIFRKVQVEFSDGSLLLTGQVPSFYLKQNLQELFRDVPHVEDITNNVDVVNSHGLSSVRSEE